VTGALLGATQELLRYHPSHADAMVIWRIHTEMWSPYAKTYIFHRQAKRWSPSRSTPKAHRNPRSVFYL
jgi:hypothetical protein